jgi:hypothetical protein
MYLTQTLSERGDRLERLSSRLEPISFKSILEKPPNEIFLGVLNLTITPSNFLSCPGKKKEEREKALEYVLDCIDCAYQVQYLSPNPSLEWPLAKIKKRYGVADGDTLTRWKITLGIQPPCTNPGKKLPNCSPFFTQKDIIRLDEYYVLFSQKSGCRFYNGQGAYKEKIEKDCWVYDEKGDPIRYKEMNDLFISDNPGFFSIQHFVLDQDFNKGNKLLTV